MSTKKKSSTRRLSSAQQPVRQVKRDLTHAQLVRRNTQMEQQIEELQRQVAMLLGSGRAHTDDTDTTDLHGSERFLAESAKTAENLKKLSANSAFSARNTNQRASVASASSACNNHTLEASPRAPLATPSITGIAAVDSHSLRVTWNLVSSATGYLIRYSTDDTFVNNMFTLTAAATTSTATLYGLQPNTLYYVSVQAIAINSADNSPFSVTRSGRTESVPESATVRDLQTWLDEDQNLFQSFSAILPQIGSTVLDTTDRKRLLGSGVRRFGYIEKVYEVSQEYPQFWPALVTNADIEKFADLVKEIDVLHNLMIWFQYASRVVQDMLLLAGDDAFRQAGMYYTTARDMASRKIPEAMQVYNTLKSFWKKRSKTSSQQEPTQKEAERDFRAVARGKKVGKVVAINESDTIIKGKRMIIDETMPKPRNEVKVEESEQS